MPEPIIYPTNNENINPKNIKKQLSVNRYIVVGVAAAIVIGASSVYWYFYKQPQSAQNFKSEYESAESLHFSGDKDKNNESIQKLEKIISQAPSKEAEAEAKLLLAVNYFQIDKVKAVDLLKEIAADESYPKLTRALAVEYIGDQYMLGSQNPSFALDNIFVGKLYASFYQNNNDPQTPASFLVIKGIRRLYEYSTQLNPLPISEYRIAEWYERRLIATPLPSLNLKLPPRSDQIINIKRHIKAGDDAFTDFANSSNKKPSQIGYAYWLKGMVYGYLAQIEKDTNYLPTAEEAFQQSLNTLKQPNTKVSGFHSLWASFYYATFLNKTYGKERLKDIKVQLDYITSSPIIKETPGFTNYLSRLAILRAELKLDRDSALSLAEIDLDFKTLLKQLGWQF